MDSLTQIIYSAMEILIKNGVKKSDVSGDSIIIPENKENEVLEELANDFKLHIASNTVNEILSGLFEYFKMLKEISGDLTLFDLYWNNIEFRSRKQ